MTQVHAEIDANGVVVGWTQMSDASPVLPGWALIPPANAALLRVGAVWDSVAQTLTLPPPDPALWYVSKDAALRRMGAIGLAIAASDVGICRGLSARMNNAEFVNLQGEFKVMLASLEVVNLPLQDPSIPGSGPVTAEYIADVCDTPTTAAERQIKRHT